MVTSFSDWGSIDHRWFDVELHRCSFLVVFLPLLFSFSLTRQLHGQRSALNGSNVLPAKTNYSSPLLGMYWLIYHLVTLVNYSRGFNVPFGGHCYSRACPFPSLVHLLYQWQAENRQKIRSTFVCRTRFALDTLMWIWAELTMKHLLSLTLSLYLGGYLPQFVSLQLNAFSLD